MLHEWEINANCYKNWTSYSVNIDSPLSNGVERECRRNRRGGERERETGHMKSKTSRTITSQNRQASRAQYIRESWWDKTQIKVWSGYYSCINMIILAQNGNYLVMWSTSELCILSKTWAFQCYVNLCQILSCGNIQNANTQVVIVYCILISMALHFCKPQSTLMHASCIHISDVIR